MPPILCADHFKNAAPDLALAVLKKAWGGREFIGWPRRWWIRYAHGYSIGGDVPNTTPSDWTGEACTNKGGGGGDAKSTA
jgi:hypothetical protein